MSLKKKRDNYIHGSSVDYRIGFLLFTTHVLKFCAECKTVEFRIRMHIPIVYICAWVWVAAIHSFGILILNAIVKKKNNNNKRERTRKRRQPNLSPSPKNEILQWRSLFLSLSFPCKGVCQESTKMSVA